MVYRGSDSKGFPLQSDFNLFSFTFLKKTINIEIEARRESLQADQKPKIKTTYCTNEFEYGVNRTMNIQSMSIQRTNLQKQGNRRKVYERPCQLAGLYCSSLH